MKLGDDDLVILEFQQAAPRAAGRSCRLVR
jgi:hypothetical protein